MKLRVLIFFLFTFNSSAIAQNRLNTSRQSGYYTYIYKLTDQDVRQFAANHNEIKDEFLRVLVDSFEYNKRYLKILPKGNYLYLSVVKNTLVYSLNNNSNVNVEFVNNFTDAQLYVKDLKGNLVNDATVTLDNRKKLTFDPKTRLYQMPLPKKDGIISVNYQGVTNYFEFELNAYDYRDNWNFFKKAIYSFPLKYTWQPFAKIYRSIKYPQKQSSTYKGYLVFSKPKYKPLDTVKFKAFLLRENGDPIKSKMLDVMLFSSYPNFEKKIASIKSYREGAYEYAFALSDSLNLKLDNRYAIKLVDPVNPTRSISSDFEYEDYELKALNFSSRTDRTEHQIGKPITLYMKATDENDLAVPDGRVEITAITTSIQQYNDQQVFVPDTLFQTKMNLDPIGETKLVLPDSIFPKADLKFSLHISFLNSNNEARSDNKYLSYVYSDQKNREEIVASLQKDSIAFEYKTNNRSISQKATILSYSYNDELLDSITTKLPIALKTDFRADNYEIKTANGYHDYIFLTDFEPKIEVLALQTKDSLSVVVQNENKIPFWYTIFSGKQVFLKGYTSTLDTILKHNNNRAIQIKTSYYWDDKEITNEALAYYDPQLLNLKLIAPDLVYPGQKVNMLIKVTDINNQPVPFTDITAQAYTSKFGKISAPNLPYFGKKYKLAKRRQKIGVDELYFSGSVPLNWEKWGKSLGLDTIAYYKFTHPDDIYVIKEQLGDSLTQIAPFVIDKGNIDPMQVIYIDGIPVFYSRTNQLQRYSFVVAPGIHNLIFRTSSKLINLKGFVIEKGKKTILSVSSDLKNKKAEVLAAPTFLSDEEADELNRYLITVENTFNEKAILKLDSTKVLINPPSTNPTNKSLLLGPFKENILRLETEELKVSFLKESNYTYTFLPGLVKQKSIDQQYPFVLSLNNYPFDESTIFKQYAFGKGEIDSIWEESLNLRSHTTPLFTNPNYIQKEIGTFRYDLDAAWSKNLPYVKNILIYKPNELDFLLIYPGNQKQFKLNAGAYKVILLLKDNRYFSIESVNIKAFGENYFKWTNLPISKADQFSIQLDSNIKAIKNGTRGKANEKVLANFNDVKFDKSLLVNTMSGRVVDAKTKEPLPGVHVKIVGLSYGVQTDANGEFELKVPKSGKIAVAYLGYAAVSISIKNGGVGDIQLKEDENALQEVIVVGYEAEARKKAVAYASTMVVKQELSGKAAGLSLMIRGNSSFAAAAKPLIILDGVIYSGDLNSLDRSNITDITTLKGDEATALYGSAALGGVIIVKTKAGATNIAAIQNAHDIQAQTMRTNFSDLGFWQPKLVTDKNGSAAFTVQFPDDITKWNTRIIALNGKKQKGFLETSIKSFKSLSANFVSPLFATIGDSINVIGKLMNYMPNEATAVRKFSYNGKLLKEGKVSFKNALIDTLAIEVNSTDSLKFEYTMAQDNGYFDGEIRKIPVIAAGVKETKGYFSALLGDTTTNYTFDKSLGEVTVRAESSIFPTLLDEMTKLRNYEYLCNEQLASKLKALLMEKKTRTYLNQQFIHEKDINVILKKLLENKKAQQTWGWWKDSNEEIWISLHVIEALLQATQEGYDVKLNKTALHNYLVNKLSVTPSYNQLQLLKLIHLLDEKYYLNDWLKNIEKMKPVEPTVFDRLTLMELKQMAGLKISIDTLLALKKQTMFGNVYWGEENNQFWNNSIQNTLLAYKILRKEGKQEAILERIRLYFLEQRKDGQWRNTYESSLILETILPDLMNVNPNNELASIQVNNDLVSKFPYDHKFTSTALNVIKKGNMPVYFTAYQQFQNSKPEKINKDFIVNTTFIQQGNPVTTLKAGKLTTLKVEVEVKADAAYVMIEIPIPAGCSYENKVQNFWGIETHREYFKEKTSIFCTTLRKGKYTFNIDVMPRYTGKYVLNPAKAEMMYFPVFFGREGMKKIEIN